MRVRFVAVGVDAGSKMTGMRCDVYAVRVGAVAVMVRPPVRSCAGRRRKFKNSRGD